MKRGATGARAIGGTMPSEPKTDFDALPDSALLTQRELATYVRVSVQTAKRWAREGLGPRITRAGTGVRYRAGDVRAWLAQETA